jgi:TPR repeat protein
VADPVVEAQKYLYGKGAPQDCDRGMHILKPAAEQANAKAMIEMGALYSAGLCTPRDLPTAYRWFAMALRKDPDNLAVQTDLQKLWGEMTQPERQLAIRLSQ